MPDNPIVDCNQAFLDLTGYPREEVIGRNYRFLAGPDTSPAARKQLRDAIAGEQPTMVEFLNYRKDGSTFINAVMIAPIFDERGELVAFLGSQFEVHDAQAPDEDLTSKSANDDMGSLTSRQREVLVALASGQQIKRVAFDLGLSERTVKMHRAAALRALGTSNTIEAIRIAIQAGY